MTPLEIVLIVDDDAALRQMLLEVLDEAGHSTAEARDVPQALEIVKSGGVLAVVIDLFTPEGDGLDLLKATLGEPPVILMSSFAPEDVLQSGLDLGAVAILHNPFRPAELLTLLESLDSLGRRDTSSGNLPHRAPFETAVGTTRTRKFF